MPIPVVARVSSPQSPLTVALAVSLLLVTKAATVHKEGPSTLFAEDLSRTNKFLKGDIVIPHICDNDGRSIPETRLKSALEDLGQTKEASQRVCRSTPDDLNVKVRVKGKTLKVRLRKLMTSSKFARVEWMNGNYTESQLINEPCLVAGEVQGHRHAHATLSLCDGVNGVINMGNKDIYIQPVASGGGTQRPHVVSVRKTRKKWRVHDGDDRLEPAKGGLPTDSADVPVAGRRHRRSAKTKPRHMEILLITDRSVIRFHGRDLWKQYLLTQMNLVNEIYHHPSLDVEINVVVTKIVIIEDDLAQRIIVEENGQRTLDQFCIWVNTQISENRLQSENHDIAVYITRRKMGPAGYAPVTGMCNPHRSCSVNRDDGISSAFVFAHEIGHTFGMVHDGEGTDCDEQAAEGNIMAGMVQSTYNNYFWSECSRDLLLSKIENMQCLTNKPDDPAWPKFKQPYGLSWSLDEQCRQEFGSGFTLCRAFQDMDPCQYLWCSTSKEPLLCKTKRGVPLPGSTCAARMWCMDGACVSSSASVAIHGYWSTWGQWSDCSRPCGTGVQYRHRTCSNPRPEHAGRDCEGDSEDMTMCNQKDCPKMTDFRAEQCARHNDEVFGNTRHHWIPLENKNTSKMCKLTCISRETQDVFVSDDDVIDGTFCSYELPYHVCIKGRCKPIGCDGKLGSNKKTDQCGVCEGDGSSCTVISGTLKKHLGKKALHRILLLPKLARNIEIKEKGSGFHLAHSLALKDGVTNQFLQTSRDTTRQSRQFVVYGTRFVYDQSSGGESLTARGPLIKPVYVMVFSMSNRLPAIIEYKFTIPKKTEASLKDELLLVEQNRYQWMLLGWTECTVSCDGGVRYEVFVCTDTRKEKTAPQMMCSLMDKPSRHRESCNEQKCPVDKEYKWESGEWTSCTASCGDQGVQQRQVKCVVVAYGQRGGEVDRRYCTSKEMPDHKRACNKMVPCPALWRVTDWSKCSVSCGSGIQQRKVACDKPKDGKKYKCQGEKPADTRICDMSACPAATTTPTTTTAATTSTTMAATTTTTMAATTTTTTAATTPTTTTIATSLSQLEDPESSGRLGNGLELDKDTELGIFTIATTRAPKPLTPKKKIKRRKKGKKERRRKKKNHNKKKKGKKSKKSGKYSTAAVPGRSGYTTVSTLFDIAKPKAKNRSCAGDKSRFCGLGVTKQNCATPSYMSLCCQSCRNMV